jgi:hypothetical protein
MNSKDSFTMPMPGTMGAATLIFKEKNMKTFNVKLDVRLVLDVDANSMDEAVAIAKHWQETAKMSWGEGEAVCWVDSYVVKETVSVETNYE